MTADAEHGLSRVTPVAIEMLRECQAEVEHLRQQNATLLRWLEAIVVGPDVTARSTARAALAQAEPEEPR